MKLMNDAKTLKALALQTLAAHVAKTAAKPASNWNPADYMQRLPVASKLIGVIL